MHSHEPDRNADLNLVELERLVFPARERLDPSVALIDGKTVPIPDSHRLDQNNLELPLLQRYREQLQAHLTSFAVKRSEIEEGYRSARERIGSGSGLGAGDWSTEVLAFHRSFYDEQMSDLEMARRLNLGSLKDFRSASKKRDCIPA